MTNAYSKSYLDSARRKLGQMIDYAVNVLGYELKTFWDMFLNSSISKMYESGFSTVLAGMSGIEMALSVINKDTPTNLNKPLLNKSKEYWTGWALSYYQWDKSLSFKKINDKISIDNIRSMYYKYHEMDIRQFVDRMDEIMSEKLMETHLKTRRKELGLSQNDLSKESGITVRTIQQYEQRQKNINAAKTESVLALSKALYCTVESLLE